MSMLAWCYKKLARPVLFAFDPEFVHNMTLKGLEWVSASAPLSGVMRSLCKSPELPVTLFGQKFPNPVGLAAGMDKGGIALRSWESMGLGFSEVGAVTWYGQPGNPPPRVFRAIADQGIVNRMGFNNEGARKLSEVLTRCKEKGRWPGHPVGINLGKSKKTSLEDAPQDYTSSFRELKELADFFVVNVSSPNTPNLRKLQDKDALKTIFTQLQEVNHKGHGKAKPILLKVAPDLTFEALEDIVELIPKLEIAGIVATNTTITRPKSDQPKLMKVYAESGGLSGKPLRERSTEVIKFLYQRTEGEIPIIGSGGVFSAEDAWEKITHGASLLQIFTSLVYEGPLVVQKINLGLQELLKANRLACIQDAVGSAVKK